MISRPVARAVAGAAVAMLVACSTSSSAAPATAAGGVQLPSALPEQQRAALADGIVTRAEYTTAYHAFVACLAEHDIQLFNPTVDPRNGLVSYGVAGEAPDEDPIGLPESPNLTTNVGRCFNDTFSWIELVFQVGDPTVQAVSAEDTLRIYRDEVVPCLEFNGVEVPDPLPELDTAEYVELLNTWYGLDDARKCDVPYPDP